MLDFIISHADGDNRPYLKVDIFGKQILGLLDSGASRTIMGSPGWKLLRDLGLKVNLENSPSCFVANGQNCSSLGTVTVPCKLETKVIVLDILIVPSLSHTLILGMDFWRSMDIIPDLKRDVWSFSSEKSNLLCAIESKDVLTPEQRECLEHLVESYFNNQGDKLGCTNLVEHKIITDSAPIKQRYYPVSPNMQRHIDDELNKMLDQDIIEESTSAWSSPILLVPKKDGGFRFCVDYRKLNAVTKKDAYPLPYISTILDQLRDARFMSSLDIKSAYWQIKMAEDSKEYTAFTVPNRGLYQFKRMPFGLHGSPALWQRLIDKVLGPKLEPYVFVYLDDIIIVTQTFEKHLEILREIFDRLSRANLTLSKEKCKFCRSELKYLGYVVNQNGLHVDPDKVKAILELPTPTSVSTLRRVIGMASWYRRFIPNFSSIISPMTALLKKNKSWLWSTACEKSFHHIKNCLISAPILSCPDFSKPFCVQTDASAFGLGCVLSQHHNDGEHVICFLSRSLTKAEKNYSTTERECLAVIWAIEKLRPYLEGSHFEVITDHHSLIWLNSLKDPTGRLARWAVRLQQHDFTIIHRKGREHVVPDILSRSVPNVDTVEVPDADNFDTSNDKWYQKMINNVSRKPLHYPNWRVRDNCLLKYVGENSLGLNDIQWKIVVPKTHRIQIIQKNHDDPTSGHSGVFKTYNRISQLYYWPMMRSDITSYVKRCNVCIAHKPEQKLPLGLMSRRVEVEKPWQLICTDLIGPLPRSSQGFSYILVVADCFSKYALFFPLRSATASAVTKRIENEIFLIYGVPQNIICDNGGQYRSKQFKKLCKEYGVTLLYNANYHPQANPAERINRVLKTMLSSYITDNHRLWDQNLAKLGCAIRTSRHEVIGHTPYFVNFGREHIVNGKYFGKNADKPTVNDDFVRESANKRSSNFCELYRGIKDKLDKAYEKSRTRYNFRRRNLQFYEGNKVWKKNYVNSDASRYFSSKLAPKYVGPYLIRKKISPWTYELESLDHRPSGVWHIKDLKGHPSDTDES